MSIVSSFTELSPRMKFNVLALGALVIAKLLFVPVAVAIAAEPAPAQAAAGAAAPVKSGDGTKANAESEEKAAYTEQGLLDAAYNFCATVQNRHAKSCECEQKLLKQPDRFDAEAREMAYYYFTDKDRFKQEFETRRKADPEWQEGFALRMSNMQALIIAACGA